MVSILGKLGIVIFVQEIGISKKMPMRKLSTTSDHVVRLDDKGADKSLAPQINVINKLRNFQVI